MADPDSSKEPDLLDQTSVPGRTPRPFGHVEVVRIKRRSRKHPELLLFKGTPISKNGVMKSVLITIGDPSSGAPPPWLDMEKGRLHLSYPSMDHPELLALLDEPSAFLCYFWTSSDGTKSLFWLLRSF